MSVPARGDIRIGARVLVVQKQHQPTGQRTEGRVTRILTRSPRHPHGIKVMLEGGVVGRVQKLAD